mmetsp:Transcript_23627/g.27133  ORF Transcript_23627/g.27133 Transcript_23627/m.27133 type:complete len:88 (+) Transcript_23627:555-818(+)
MPSRKRNQKMLHLGNGYSKLLQSYNYDTFSPDASFRYADQSESEMHNHHSVLRTIDRELDPAGLELSTRKLPHIRSSSNFKRFTDNA